MKTRTIHLAVHGKVFGPFEENELQSLQLSDYRWIFRSWEAAKGWQPLDPMPGLAPPAAGSPHAEPPRALVYIAEQPTAVSGTLQEVRARGGWLESGESRIRLTVGEPVRLQLLSPEPRSLHSRVERIETGPTGVRYRLSWDPVNAP